MLLSLLHHFRHSTQFGVLCFNSAFLLCSTHAFFIIVHTKYWPYYVFVLVSLSSQCVCVFWIIFLAIVCVFVIVIGGWWCDEYAVWVWYPFHSIHRRSRFALLFSMLNMQNTFYHHFCDDQHQNVATHAKSTWPLNQMFMEMDFAENKQQCSGQQRNGTLAEDNTFSFLFIN